MTDASRAARVPTRADRTEGARRFPTLTPPGPASTRGRRRRSWCRSPARPHSACACRGCRRGPSVWSAWAFGPGRGASLPLPWADPEIFNFAVTEKRVVHRSLGRDRQGLTHPPPSRRGSGAGPRGSGRLGLTTRSHSAQRALFGLLHDGVAGLTQRLPVRARPEELHCSSDAHRVAAVLCLLQPVRHDMVYVCGRNRAPVLIALLAQRMRSDEPVTFPTPLAVVAALSRRAASLVLRAARSPLVLRAEPSAYHQLRAAWFSAWLACGRPHGVAGWSSTDNARRTSGVTRATTTPSGTTAI